MDTIQMQFDQELHNLQEWKRDKIKLHNKTNNFCPKHFSVKPRPDHVLMYDLKRKMRKKS